MFTPEDRARLRDALLAAARGDDRITGAALTGSAAVGAEDRWSDIAIAGALVRSLEPAELARAFLAAAEALLAEIGHADAGLAGRLAGPLRELAG